MPAGTIYCLTCPQTGRVMYVGKTGNTKRRLQQHEADYYRSGSAKDAWIKDLKKFGWKPVMKTLEEASDWEEAERRWIKSLGGASSLLNVAGGGVPCWVDRAKRAGPWHRKVIARFLSLAKSAPEKSDTFNALADAYRAMQVQARRCGQEREYEDHLKAVFGGALS